MRHFYFSTIINLKCALLNLFTLSSRSLYNTLGRHCNAPVPFSLLIIKETQSNPARSSLNSKLNLCVRTSILHKEPEMRSVISPPYRFILAGAGRGVICQSLPFLMVYSALCSAVAVDLAPDSRYPHLGLFVNREQVP